MLFATYKVYTVSKDEGFNQTRTQAIGDGRREYFKTTERPAYLAKNRIDGLPKKYRFRAMRFRRNSPKPFETLLCTHQAAIRPLLSPRHLSLICLGVWAYGRNQTVQSQRTRTNETF